MKIYRVSLFKKDGDGHGGYIYESSKVKARKAAALLSETHEAVRTEVVHINTTKRGMLNFLNDYCGHPDNG